MTGPRMAAIGLAEYGRLMEAAGIVPFQREPWINPRTGEPDPLVLGRRVPWRWRVGRGEWDRLVAGSRGVEPTMTRTIGGFEVTIDDRLPSDRVIFEPIPGGGDW